MLRTFMKMLALSLFCLVFSGFSCSSVSYPSDEEILACINEDLKLSGENVAQIQLPRTGFIDGDVYECTIGYVVDEYRAVYVESIEFLAKNGIITIMSNEKQGKNPKYKYTIASEYKQFLNTPYTLQVGTFKAVKIVPNPTDRQRWERAYKQDPKSRSAFTAGNFSLDGAEFDERYSWYTAEMEKRIPFAFVMSSYKLIFDEKKGWMGSFAYKKNNPEK